jgi:hypothetical protein
MDDLLSLLADLCIAAEPPVIVAVFYDTADIPRRI